VEGEEGEGIEGRKRPRHIAGSSIDEIVLTWAQCAKKGLLFVLKSAKRRASPWMDKRSRDEGLALQLQP
jgi:hypothetical protein